MQKTAIGMTLTWTAGFVDVVGYMSVYGIYTAHMSGNTVSMSRHIARLQWLGVARHGWPIIMFVIGLIIGTSLFELEKRALTASRIPINLVLEALLIASFLALGAGAHFRAVIPPQPSDRYYLMIALLALAMGAQNVTIRKIGGLNVYTTFVTGSLVKFGESAANYFLWLYDHVSTEFGLIKAFRLSLRQPSAERMRLTANLWLWYVFGAVIGVISFDRVHLICIAIPLFALIGVMFYGALRPFMTLAEEEW